MIEINLIPDVKQELIRARRVRSTVISGAILVSIAAAAVVVVLGIYIFGVQTVRGALADNSIKTEHEKLAKVEDLPNMLTVQNQLSKLSQAHDEKLISSRVFDTISVIIPPEPNSVAISRLVVDAEEGTIQIDAQASNGYSALETFKKTLEATKITYTAEGESGKKTSLLASDIVEGERSYGDDESGRKVLRFSLTFTYDENLFSRQASNLVITGPDRTNATDSYIGIPQSLFTNKASDQKETN